jgi:putative transcriptional regulator
MTHPSKATTGRLLVAQPSLEDSNFDRTVVFMIEHNDEGALGVVLNRPTELLIAEVVPEWRDVAADPVVLHVGGPVGQTSVIALGLSLYDASSGGTGFTPVVGRIGTVDLNAAPANVAPGVEGVRLFAGHSGWGPGQLDWELDVDSWFVVDAEPTDVLDPYPETLWRRVLQRQPDRLQLLAHYPPDIRVN